MTLSEQIDEILFSMSRGELIATHKDTPNLYRLAVDRALGQHLIYPYKNTYKLDDNGYKAIDLGGFDKWLVYDEQQKNLTPSTVNTLTFHAPMTGIVNQDSSLRDLSDSTIATNAIPAENEKQQKAKVSIVEKWVVPIIIAIIGGVILLLIEHKTGWFSGH